MYLKRIDIQGFKSFADKTSVTFMPPGKKRHSVTAVVGPNGSGKSNISDAIRWVMGEQSMKALRGKKSEDIIFAGSVSKGKMSVASVTLTIDNRDHRLPIEYDEVTVGRKVYRSGESEYLVNGHPVRLLDVQLLLARGQFGQGSYSVVGQGMIDRLLLQSAEERKTFFDEAAGIKEFQIKRHQAGLKLERSRANVEQADMLLREIAPRLKSLKRQVKKREQRQETEQALREYQEQYYATIWRDNQQTLQTEREARDALNGELKKKEIGLHEIQEELAGLAKRASRQERFDALQRAHEKLVRQKHALERERAVLAGKMQTAYSEAGKQNIGWVEQKIVELEDQRKSVEADLVGVQALLSKAEQAVQDAVQTLDTTVGERQRLHARVEQLRQRTIESKQEQSYWQFTGLQAVQAVLLQRERFGGVHGVVAQLASVPDRYQSALDVAAGSHVTSIVVADDRVGANCIEYLRRERLGYATFLPMNKIKPRFVPQEVCSVLDEPGVCGLAADLAEYNERYETIFSFVFGGTLIVEDIETARSLGVGRFRMVTLDGDVFERSGSMKGGHRTRRKNSVSFSSATTAFDETDDGAAEDAFEKAELALRDADAAYEVAQRALQQAEADKMTIRQKVDMLTQKRDDVAAELKGFEQERHMASLSEDEYSGALKDVKERKEDIDSRLAAMEADMEKSEAAIAAFNAEEEEKKQRVFSLQEQMQTLQQSVNTLVQDKNQHDVALARLETKQEDVAAEVGQELHEDVARVAERTDVVLSPAQLHEAKEHIQKLKYKLSLIGGIDDAVVEEYEQTKERHDELDTQVTDLQDTIEDLESLIAELDDIMRKKRKKAFKNIRTEFQRYFALLFDGGAADLVEVYGDEKKAEDEEGDEDRDVVKRKGKKMLKGIDIKACPPGKKINHLQALSGGERTMTSIALVCAILRTNPSPFVVLDEVEAALDEANSMRLTNILQELAEQSQFILITHNRATMHAADALFGVTMGRDGVSSLVSVELKEAEQVVEREPAMA